MTAEKGWAHADAYGADMADDCIEVASWCDVGTRIEPQYDYDAAEWR